MFHDARAFSSFSVSDFETAKTFYSETLGLETAIPPGMEDSGMFELHLGNGYEVIVYEKPDHVPAVFTILNFSVKDIDTTITALKQANVPIMHYDRADLPQDENGIARGISAGTGPDVAWFTDPSGNVLAAMQFS